MGKAKRSRKVSSIKKALRKQKQLLEALHLVQISCISNGFASATALICAAKYTKAGMQNEAVIEISKAEQFATNLKRYATDENGVCHIGIKHGALVPNENFELLRDKILSLKMGN